MGYGGPGDRENGGIREWGNRGLGYRGTWGRMAVNICSIAGNLLFAKYVDI